MATIRSAAIGSALALFSAVAPGCGIPIDEEARPLSTADGRRSEIITGIPVTSATTLPTSTNAPSLVNLFYVGASENGRELETVERPVISLNEALELLAVNPSPDERPELREAGIVLQTFVPPEMNPVPRGKDEERGVQRLEVSADETSGLRAILQDTPDTGRLIASQLVCTILNLNLVNVNGVEIYDAEPTDDEDGPAPIPLIDNSAQTIDRPANADDFGGCLTGTEKRELEAEQNADTSTTATATTTTTDGDTTTESPGG